MNRYMNSSFVAKKNVGEGVTAVTDAANKILLQLMADNCNMSEDDVLRQYEMVKKKDRKLYQNTRRIIVYGKPPIKGGKQRFRPLTESYGCLQRKT